MRNPCRMALSHLRGAELAWDSRLPSVAACSEPERSVLARQLEIGLNTVPTSSMGRLFDAMSSLAGVCQRIAYEAEAAMRFEGLARSAIERTDQGYEFIIRDDEGMIIADPATAINTVALSGGVFLNVLLTRLAVHRLQNRGFCVLRHHLVPPSDAGIALGQLVIGAAAVIKERNTPCA